jgi:hypothetical protein
VALLVTRAFESRPGGKWPLRTNTYYIKPNLTAAHCNTHCSTPCSTHPLLHPLQQPLLHPR